MSNPDPSLHPECGVIVVHKENPSALFISAKGLES